jgi:lipid A 3-O-deacylase
VKHLVLQSLFALAIAAPAQAGEVFGGLYVHDVDTPLTHSGIEDGIDVQLGYRWDPIGGGTRGVQPYLFAAANTAGETHYAAAGISYKFGDRVFVRPGIGLAVHSGSAGRFQRRDRIAFGSRILFEPEIGIGFRISPRATVEASWVHMSHAQLFGRQNPGIDNFGARLNWRL